MVMVFQMLILKLLNFHRKYKKLVIHKAVQPTARFGAVKFSGKFVKSFKEKSKIDEGWVMVVFLLWSQVF